MSKKYIQNTDDMKYQSIFKKKKININTFQVLYVYPW